MKNIVCFSFDVYYLCRRNYALGIFCFCCLKKKNYAFDVVVVKCALVIMHFSS